MRSFALWYSPQSKYSGECSAILKPDSIGQHTHNKKINEKLKEVSVHINLSGGKESPKKYYFDFGFLVEDISGIETLYLYCPFDLESDKSQIKDLGKIISENKLVNAIFNESYTTTGGNPKRLVVNKPESGDPSFIIYSLDIENQVDIKKCKRDADTPGSILAIKVNDIKYEEIKKYYFRIRIAVPGNDVQLINDRIQGDSVFQRYFTNTEVIDFRLNDIRSCSEELREQFNKGKKFGILATHYLVLRDANDVIIHHGMELSSRMLEDNLWRTYFDESNYDMIAYHFKSKAIKRKKKVVKYVDDFTALTRFQYQRGTTRHILLYIGVIILVGIITGVVGNWVSKYVFYI